MWPVTHYIVITRGLFLKGVGLEILMGHTLYLMASALILSGLAVWRFKKKLASRRWTTELRRRLKRATKQAGCWLQRRVQTA
jgi:hypothetical protein